MAQTTKNALADSLKTLLETRPVSKITISDITEHCGVNRMTFYYHFQDLYDLLEWSWIREANKVLNGKKTYSTWQQGFLQIFHAVSDNKQIVMNIYHSVNREQIEIYLYKLTYDLLIGVIEENAADMDVRDDDKKFIADFYKYAFVGLILDWIKNGIKTDPAQIIERLDILIHGDIKKALNKFRTDKTYQTAADD